MYKVIGASAERVPITDLSEFIYYKQKRIFTEEEYNKSKDLQRAIKTGKVIILEENKERKDVDTAQNSIPPESQIVFIKEESKVVGPVKEEVKKEDSFFVQWIL